MHHHHHQDPYHTNINPPFPEHEHLNCPRCDSTNTKFCYYNNYNLLQPRHFCKSCRRYWTKGGTLRKIPIGGGTRKIAKRSSTSNKPPEPTPPPPPPDQLKPERSAVVDFSYDRGVISGGSFNFLLRSSFVDDLATKLSGGSEDDGLNKTPATEAVHNNHGGRGESSGSDSGGNGWPDLSVFRSGSMIRIYR